VAPRSADVAGLRGRRLSGHSRANGRFPQDVDPPVPKHLGEQLPPVVSPHPSPARPRGRGSVRPGVPPGQLVKAPAGPEATLRGPPRGRYHGLPRDPRWPSLAPLASEAGAGGGFGVGPATPGSGGPGPGRGRGGAGPKRTLVAGYGFDRALGGDRRPLRSPDDHRGAAPGYEGLPLWREAGVDPVPYAPVSCPLHPLGGGRPGPVDRSRAGYGREKALGPPPLQAEGAPPVAPPGGHLLPPESGPAHPAERPLHSAASPPA